MYFQPLFPILGSFELSWFLWADFVCFGTEILKLCEHFNHSEQTWSILGVKVELLESKLSFWSQSWAFGAKNSNIFTIILILKEMFLTFYWKGPGILLICGLNWFMPRLGVLWIVEAVQGVLQGPLQGHTFLHTTFQCQCPLGISALATNYYLGLLC